jgi:hypothetical protein
LHAGSSDTNGGLFNIRFYIFILFFLVELEEIDGNSNALIKEGNLL